MVGLPYEDPGPRDRSPLAVCPHSSSLGTVKKTTPSQKTHERLDKGELITSKKKVAGSEFQVGRHDGHRCARPRDLAGSRPMRRLQAHDAAGEEVEGDLAGSKVRCEVLIDMPSPLDDLRTVTDAVHTVVREEVGSSVEQVEGDFKTIEAHGPWSP